MKKFKLMLITFLLSFTLALSGCSSTKVDPATLLDEVKSNLKKVDSYAMQTKMDFEMQLKSGKTKMNVEAVSDTTSKIDLENEIVFNQGSQKVSALGFNQDEEVKSYITYVEDELVKFDYDFELEEWNSDYTDTLIEMDIKDFVKTLQSLKDIKSDGSGKVNGDSTYALEANLDLDELADLINFSDNSDALSMFGDLDFKGEELTIRFEVYKDTKLPAKISMDLTEAFTPLFEQAAKSQKELEGFEFSADKATFDIEFSNYDDVSVKLPKALKNYTLDDIDSYDFDDDFETIEGVEKPEGPWTDFSFTLKDKSYKLPVAYSELASSGFTVTSENEALTIEPGETEYYVMFHDSDGNEFYASLSNTGKSAIALKDATVTSISLDSYVIDKADFIVFAGGLKVGMTEQELNKIYPEFSDKTIYTNFTSYEYRKNGSHLEYVRVDIDEDGFITEIAYSLVQ